jgi:hypothetical protein
MIELLDLQSREERTELLKQELLNIEKQTQLHQQIHELEKNQYNIPPKSRSPVSPSLFLPSPLTLIYRSHQPQNHRFKNRKKGSSCPKT